MRADLSLLTDSEKTVQYPRPTHQAKKVFAEWSGYNILVACNVGGAENLGGKLAERLRTPLSLHEGIGKTSWPEVYNLWGGRPKEERMSHGVEKAVVVS